MVRQFSCVHLLDHGQEYKTIVDGIRSRNETARNETGVSHDTEVGKMTTDYRVLDVRRPIWPLGSMMDSGCDVHFPKNRCWISKDDWKELDMICSGGVSSKSSSKEANTLETQSHDSRGVTYFGQVPLRPGLLRPALV